MRFITYCRVSTDKQGIRGLGMAAQDDAVARYIASVGGELIQQYTEVETGKGANPNRPQLRAALAHCKIVGATLLIAKLDRLARNVYFVSGLMESGVDFIAADMPTANRLTIHVMAAFAEHEAKVISERTKAGLVQARIRGSKLGGFRLRAEITPVQRELALQIRQESARVRAASYMPMIRLIRDTGASSLQAVAAQLNASNIPAPRGGLWSAMQVSRIESSAR